MLRFMPACAAGGLAAVLLLIAAPASADIKIGVIYDQTGPFAGAGSVSASIGTQIAIDMINEKGGIEGRKLVPVNVDAQSKADVAINAAERLLNDDKVDLVMGVYSSAQCVPMAAKVDSAKKAGGMKQASAAARKARADSLFNGVASTMTFRIVGQTVDVQALTQFMKNLDASPFIKNVQLTRSDLVTAEGKEVTEFQLEAQTEVPPAHVLQTVPLSIAVR